MKELFILASGTMARALANGLKDKYKISFVGRNITQLEALKHDGFNTILYEDFNLEGKDIILAFKPYALDEVSNKLKAKARLLISVLANTDLKSLEVIKADNYARIMPNIAATFKASTTPFICKNELFKDEIITILQSFGQAFELEKESQMNAAMALSGCAPAFLAMVAESMSNAGVYEGLSVDLSSKLMKATFQSFSALVQDIHPALIKEQICSPGGVTIKGVRALEDKNLRSAFFKAIHASANNLND
ncbi:pyrroline-5-carboxylate reductase [Campylobacter sp. MIT 97-5078]|uniref:pyrroline-5-carboxylate reductase n=1 Tax=Campylobacter sp. MIT 97-5078 TaxID=1548153 RepID=UPI0009DFB572|nr:pyrroline-5-carboxylate reductase [Campylobacter sp. MIT 97-5078]TQR27994.1 pyrroline-5-carboxylate reductase [Campylobacter sp. MIT 97-5078]